MNSSVHSPPPPLEKSTPDPMSSVLKSALLLILACFFSAFSLQLILENPSLSQSFVSNPAWQDLVVNSLGGELITENLPAGSGQTHSARVPFWPCLGLVGGLMGLTALFLFFLPSASFLIRKKWQKEAAVTSDADSSWGERLVRVNRLARWWGVLGFWGFLWLFSLLFQAEALAGILQGTVVFWVSLTIAGTFYELLTAWHTEILWFLSQRQHVQRLQRQTAGGNSSENVRSLAVSAKISPAFAGVLLGMGLYIVVMTAMNWGLWFNLRIPHGDASMYEEHLWNVLHGKGFRSYLDQGLFWGEHIQFIHLFLLPLYWFWPSHLLLELCQSTALAIGAIPVYRMAKRASGSDGAGLLLSLAYLLYFPLQFLDISVDLKSFRPMAFSVPLVLFALDQIELKRYRVATLLLLFALTSKEDLSITIFSVGLVLTAQAVVPLVLKRGKQLSQSSPHASVGGQKLTDSVTDARNETDSGWKYGLFYLLFAPVYLLSALRLIRWFRSGVEVHYAGYFTKFGQSTNEIIWNMLTNPGLLFGELLTGSTLVYALAILLPLGFLPLRGGMRLLGCLPMFVLLCLNELASDPRHHFHAPLVPLVFWAAAGGLRYFRKAEIQQDSLARQTLESQEPDRIVEPVLASTQTVSLNRARWALSCSLATTLWFSMTPLGIAFWDPGSSWNGNKLYFPDERARMFAEIEGLIPQSARVASTDFVHPRFTHHERSYDYSNYARKVSGYELQVPEDTDYIVIDTGHPYSTIRSVDQVREIQEEPEKWEVVPNRSRGYFIVLKRKVNPDETNEQGL